MKIGIIGAGHMGSPFARRLAAADHELLITARDPDEARRAAAEAGARRAVTEREADDLVRDADRFLALIETSLGLAGHAPFQVA